VIFQRHPQLFTFKEETMVMLSVVIPAYNEEKGIAEIVNRVLSVKSELRKVDIDEFELLVVNDGSRDRTCEIASEISLTDPCVRVINHPKNRGYGAALKTGFSKARGELIGFLDADGTYPPEYFPQLCKAAMNGGDIVIGSRMMGADSKMPLTRRIGNLFFAGLLSLLGAHRVTDSASGMRVFKKCILERILPLPDGLNLTPVMSTRALHENLSMVEVAIPYSERLGRSKLSVIRDGRIFLESMVWTVLSYNPVRIFGFLGLLGLVFAGLIAAGLVIARFSGVTTLGPWGVAALYTALVCGVGGISVFALGAAFNYLVSLFYKTPIRQGLFGRPILKTPIENYFGWVGLALTVVGTVIALVALIFGIGGWEITRLWLYLLSSAMISLVGIQLLINWFLMRILSELSKRHDLVEQDFHPA
jgi:glycosyltransferase involved in cell wall biosynthesis